MCHFLSVAAKWLLNPYNSIKFKLCTHVTDDRQTDRATEKCVAIGGNACTRTTPPNNVCTTAFTVCYKQQRMLLNANIVHCKVSRQSVNGAPRFRA